MQQTVSSSRLPVRRPVRAPATRRQASGVRPSASLQHEPRLLQPQHTPDASSKRLLVFLPGMDGTGQAIITQVPSLTDAGFDVRCLYIPPGDRSTWPQLTAKTVTLLRNTLAARPPRPDGTPPRITLVAESFGGCLALRVAAAAPELLEAAVVVNPATCFGDSLGGLAALVAATNLLQLFPEQLYNIAQAVMLPLLVDTDRVAAGGVEALRAMIHMTPPPDMIHMTPPPDMEAGSSSSSSSGPTQRTPPSSSSRPPPRSGPPLPLPQTELYAPAAAANHRANMLREGGLPDSVLARIQVPTLVIASARDRLLPSLFEGARLQRVMPSARRLILPDSSHTALLERDVRLVALLRRAGLLPLFRASRPATTIPSPPTPAPPPVPPPSSVTTPTSPSTVPSIVATRGVAAATAAAAAAAAAAANGSLPSSSLPPDALPAAAVQQNGNGLPPQQAPTTTSSNGTTSAAGARDGAASTSTSSSSSSSSSSPAAGGGASRLQTASTASSTASSNGSNSGAVPQPWDGAQWAAEGGGGEGQAPGGAQQGGVNMGLTDEAYDEWSQRLTAYRELVSPVVLGADALPDPAATAAAGQPVLFVGNHGKMGLYDTPLLVYELYIRGFKVSGLAHPGHWSGPMGEFFESFGAVRASPKAAYQLLRSGRNVLLFPGGAREVTKKKGEEYRLFWRDTPDFVRMASRMGALIVPFAAVGADDAYDVMLEVDEVLQHPVLGPAVKGLLERVDPSLRPEDSVLPLTRLPGLGLPMPVPVPNLQRLYYKFCDPIDTRLPQYAGGRKGPQAEALYAHVRAAVEGGMEELLALREADAESQVGARLQRGLEKWLPAFGIAATSAPAATSASSATSALSSSAAGTSAASRTAAAGQASGGSSGTPPVAGSSAGRQTAA